MSRSITRVKLEEDDIDEELDQLKAQLNMMKLQSKQ